MPRSDPPRPPLRARRLPLAAALPLLAAALAAGCAGPGPRAPRYATEDFATTTTHTRDYPAAAADTCEAARRALLSQGFFISAASDEQLSGRKQFQPAAEVHVEVEMRVVCAPAAAGRPGSTAFATAVQDRYELKKVNNSASVGVGAIGSLSLPFAASSDALVKVASETLTGDDFYDRFFTLMERYLPAPPAAPPGAAGPVAVPVTQAKPPPVRELAPAAPAATPSPADVPIPPTASRG